VSRHCKITVLVFVNAVFADLKAQYATCDGMHRILGLLFPLELMVRELIVFVNANLLFVGFVSLCEFCCLVFSPCVMLLSKEALSGCARSRRVRRTCFWMGRIFTHFRAACVLLSL